MYAVGDGHTYHNGAPINRPINRPLYIRAVYDPIAGVLRTPPRYRYRHVLITQGTGVEQAGYLVSTYSVSAIDLRIPGRRAKGIGSGYGAYGRSDAAIRSKARRVVSDCVRSLMVALAIVPRKKLAYANVSNIHTLIRRIIPC